MLRTVPRPLLVIGALVIAAVLVAAGAWALLGNRDDDTGHATEAIEPSLHDPVVAATGTLSVILSYAPAEQDTPYDQYAPIIDRLTGPTRQLAENPPTGEEAAKAIPTQWNDWKASGDRVRALVSSDTDHTDYPDDATEASIPVNVTEQVVHYDNSTTPLSKYTATVKVVKPADVWLFDSYTINDITY